MFFHERVPPVRSYATPAAPPPKAVRDRERDWRALSEQEQMDVIAYQLGHLLLDEVALRGQVFVRRHVGVRS